MGSIRQERPSHLYNSADRLEYDNDGLRRAGTVA
jgi:hypothetical protein